MAVDRRQPPVSVGLWHHTSRRSRSPATPPNRESNGRQYPSPLLPPPALRHHSICNKSSVRIPLIFNTCSVLLFGYYFMKADIYILSRKNAIWRRRRCRSVYIEVLLKSEAGLSKQLYTVRLYLYPSLLIRTAVIKPFNRNPVLLWFEPVK